MQETYLMGKAGEAEREQRILSHALADRDAELQLQETRTKVLEFAHSFTLMLLCVIYP